LTGTADAAEWARVDYLEFVPTSADPNPNEDPEPVLSISYATATGGVTVDLQSDTVSYLFGTLPAETLKILPLGDSNTRGYPNQAPNGGYRTRLWNLLNSSFSNLDFIGRMASGPGEIDRDHEGRGGFTIDELMDGGGPMFQQPTGVTLPDYGSIEQALAGQPDVVLLMAGTNDINQGDSPNTAIADLQNLLDRAVTAAPNTHFLVASINPNLSSESREANTAEYSNRINAEVVEPLANAGHLVSFVDIFNDAALEANDYQSDGYHLVSSGYDALADVWYDSLLTTIVRQSLDSTIDSVIGSAFDDVLIGDNADNYLVGDSGDDQLTGNAGIDTFVISQNSGFDTITDFQIGIDLIELADGLTFGQLAIAQGSNENNTNTLLSSGGQLIALLENVLASDLQSSSFVTV